MAHFERRFSRKTVSVNRIGRGRCRAYARKYLKNKPIVHGTPLAQWSADIQLMKPNQESTVVSHGKFFARDGRKFFLKAIRLEDTGGVSDFDQKLRLRARLDQ